MKAWREAATLIIAARNGIKFNNYNYKLLFLKRKSNAKFGGSYVFPGGLIEPADADLKWQNLFKNYGYNENNFKSLYPKSKNRPQIFNSKKNEIPREISLRISAIRETFEECGILLCKKASNSTTVLEQAQHFFLPDDELVFWQKKVYSDANEFYNMCEELQCYPNVWALYEWGNWLTPTFIPSSMRYDSIFFFTCLSQIPSIKLDYGEVEDHLWETPDRAMSSLISVLPPPQQYEISLIAKYKNLSELLDIAIEKSRNGVEMFFPVRVILHDGAVHLLAGDSMYPDKVDLNKKMFLDKTDMTIRQYRDLASKTHRMEMFDDPEKNNFISKL